MKYIIRKADGTPVDPRARYFVLRVDDDPARADYLAARAALVTYAHEAYNTDREAAQAAMDALDGPNNRVDTTSQ
jgi:hypothetical protein